ncbi:hypothetical protein Tco_0754619 [Tanacetum coccineum]
MFSNLPHSHSLNCMDRETLERQVTLEEIKEAVWDCGSSKAPGPDGYSFAFVKNNKDEVLSMASNAGCMAGDIPFNYLGLPIGSNMKSIASWKDLLIVFILASSGKLIFCRGGR